MQLGPTDPRLALPCAPITNQVCIEKQKQKSSVAQFWGVTSLRSRFSYPCHCLYLSKTPLRARVVSSVALIVLHARWSSFEKSMYHRYTYLTNLRTYLVKHRSYRNYRVKLNFMNVYSWAQIPLHGTKGFQTSLQIILQCLQGGGDHTIFYPKVGPKGIFLLGGDVKKGKRILSNPPSGKTLEKKQVLPHLVPIFVM